MTKKFLLGLSTVLTSVAVAPASAQTGRDESAGQITEIIVTAQRREETLQRAAISVNAISAEQLTDAGVGTSPTDLNRLVPSAQIASNGSAYPSFYIRGIGNVTTNSYTDATVGVNYDGVPITRQAATIGMFYDLERVEVLKGPQGTLYGRNNTGGAINILPAHPELGEFGGNVAVTAGNHKLWQGTGFLNAPLGETAAVRASFNVIDRDGYYDNGLSDDKGRSARLQLRVQPTDRIRANFGLDYHDQSGNGAGSTLLNTTNSAIPGYATSNGQPYRGDAWRELNQNCDGVHALTPPYDVDDFPANNCSEGDNNPSNDPYVDEKFLGLTGTIDVDFPWATLTVVPAARYSDVDVVTSGGFVAVRDKQDGDTYSLELRLASDSSNRFNWIIGAYGLDESVDAVFRVFNGFLSQRQSIDMKTESQAAFATGRYSITDAFRVSLGARYTHDSKSFNGVSPLSIFGGPPQTVIVDQERTWNKSTYRAGVEYDVAPNSMLFATYETGYKAGGFFFSDDRDLGTSFDPETVKAYTIGSRNVFFDRRLLLNADIFKYLYRDQQVSQIAFQGPNSANPGLQVFPTVNFGAVDYEGAEVEAQFYLAADTLLRADVQFLKSELVTAPFIGDPRSVTADVRNGDAPNSPDLTATLGIEQTFTLGAGYLVANLSGQYRSEMLAGTEFTPWQYVPSVTTGDFSLRYGSEDGVWTVTGFVNNFTDEEVPTFVSGTGSIAPPNPGSPPRTTYRAPRTFGVRIAVDF